jgi:hypothetical protein
MLFDDIREMEGVIPIVVAELRAEETKDGARLG